MSLFDALLLDPHPFNVWIAYRTDGVKGSGTASDPYDGSSQGKFDLIMSNLAAWYPNARLRVHLGPSPRTTNNEAIPFETKGYSPDQPTGGWQPSRGMKIVGSGIDVTVLRLNPTTQNIQQYAIGHDLTTGSPAVPNPLDGVEVSDLTIDCNISATTAGACGAIRLLGSHCRIRRVKAVNWGTKSATKPCYVMSVVTAYPGTVLLETVNSGIDECLLLSPYGSNAAAVTVLHAGSPEELGFASEGFGKSPFIRNCFVDCGITTPNRTTGKLRALSMGWCRGGIIEGNQIHNVDIGGPYQDQRSARDIIVRNNYYQNVACGPCWTLGGNGIGVSRAIVEGNTIELPPAVASAVAAVVMDNNESSPPDYVHGDIIIRNNKCRYVDGAAGQVASAAPFQAQGAAHLIVSNNIIETTAAHPLTNSVCGTATYFNNKTPGGVLLQGWNSDTSRKYDELETEAEDAFIMAFFEKR